MKCSYHPAVESQEKCNACTKPLCSECAHKIKGKPYCQDCLVEGAEWIATFKGLRSPADSPKRAALCAIIPGLGAVYNNEYMKAITYFAVWAALAMMGSKVNGIFGFAAFVFIIFTMFDAYRTAEAIIRKRIKPSLVSEGFSKQDKTVIGWGIFLMILGLIFLLQNILPYYFLSRLWPLVFILLGAFLVYRAIQNRESQPVDSSSPSTEPKEDI